MKITKALIETTYGYKNSDDDGYLSDNYKYALRVSIPIPGGNIIFEYVISKDEYNSLEKAAKLADDK